METYVLIRLKPRIGMFDIVSTAYNKDTVEDAATALGITIKGPDPDHPDKWFIKPLDDRGPLVLYRSPKVV